MNHLQEQEAASINRAFQEEYLRFVVDRAALTKFVPTSDCFPLICQLMHEAKQHYRSLPRVKRNNLRFIPFSFFGKEWRMRINFAVTAHRKAVYIDLCAAERRTALMTLCVGFDNDLLECADA